MSGGDKVKLKKSFITHTTGNEQILVAADNSFSGLVRSNQTAAFIVDCLKKETSEAEILKKMEAAYGAPRAIMEEDLKMVLGKLRSIGALTE